MSSPSTRSRSRNASENDPAAASSSRPANPLAFLGLKRVGDEDDNDVKKAATQAIFDAAEAFLAPVMARRPLALSLEMRDIDPDLSPKTGTIRDYLKD